MKTRITAIVVYCGFLAAGYAAHPDHLKAQAAPGPLPSPQSQGIPVPPPRARPKRQEPAPRTTIAGIWKLNRDESDDPSRKLKDTKGKNAGNYPRTSGGIGFPYPGGGPMGGSGVPRQGNEDWEDPKLLDVVQPASSLSIELKTAEVDVTVNEGRKMIFYTDGRQLQKAKDATVQEFAAHWDGTRLVTDEKSPEKGKMSRTFELSQDGRQFYETLHVDTNRSKTPVVIEYVYDISGPEVPLTHETDPDQPVMKRHPDKTDASPSSGQSSGTQPADPDQPTMKRRTDDSGDATTQSPQAQPSSTPDPDQPVMKRRGGGSN